MYKRQVYWYDTPDLISSVGSVQVQRGAGISTNGTGAFGGAVNMTTAPIGTDFSGEASLSYGSYNTNKQAVRISSGLLGDHWVVDARLTHIGSDGYIDRGATDLKSCLLYTSSAPAAIFCRGGIVIGPLAERNRTVICKALPANQVCNIGFPRPRKKGQ